MTVATTLLADRYRAGRRLGQGSTSEAFEGHDVLTDRRVAIRILDHRLAEDAEFVRRFHQEAWEAASLTHPGMARVLDVNEDGGRHFIVQEYVEGRSLADLLADEGALPVAEACRIVRSAASALAAATCKGWRTGG
jgi:eukaryotic-like serine/threonine-protein kinase